MSNELIQISNSEHRDDFQEIGARMHTEYFEFHVDFDEIEDAEIMDRASSEEEFLLDDILD